MPQPIDSFHGSGSVRGGLLRWQVRRVALYVEQHLDATCRIRQLADLVHLSPSRFARAFRQTLDCPPAVYIRRRRVAYAQRLMLTANLTLAEIAVLSGMSDQAHLCRVFRKIVGTSPAAWCRQAGIRKTRRARSTTTSGHVKLDR
jgi:AraC family transcriptional regulator